MKISILGSGLMGSALGIVWARAGHEVTFAYSRSFAKLETLAQRAGNGAKAASPSEAVSQADVVLISVPWRSLDDLLSQTGSLAGKTVISCMLPMTADDSALAFGFDTSGAEQLAERTKARVIGTFNTVWSNVITGQLKVDGASPSMFYVTDDNADTKQTAEMLIRDAGFEPVYAGVLTNARLLEPFGLLMGQMGFDYDPLVAYRFFKP